MDIYERVTRFYEGVKTEKAKLGQTYFGRTVYAMKAGSGRPTGIASYAIHGREYITARLAFAQYERGVKRGSCWFVPLVNPDGALLSERGLSTAPSEERERLLDMNGSDDFFLWKANGRGVDLNVNFPARWGQGVKNVRIVGSENYIGSAPCSEMETRALMRFTLAARPDYTVSYHTKGEEIYWRFYQPPERAERDYSIGKILADKTGYPLREALGSVGGYKDWCIEKLKIPAFTVEVGKDCFPHPLGEDALSDIIEKNGGAIYALSEKLL